MTVGYRNAAGVDFDSLFDPYASGTSPAATGYRDSSGVDLAGRYAPISVGSKGPDVGYRTSAGVDLSNLWAAIGTATYSIAGLGGKALNAGDSAATNQSQVTATVGVTIASTGAWSVSGSNSQGNIPQTAPTSGTWLPAGHSVSDYEVQFNTSSSGSADRVLSNGAPTYAACTTSRSAGLVLPSISANNAIERDATGTCSILLRRISTGVVTTTNITFHVATSGYL